MKKILFILLLSIIIIGIYYFPTTGYKALLSIDKSNKQNINNIKNNITSVEGRLEIIMTDNFENNTASTIYNIRTEGNKYINLKLPETQSLLGIPSGTKISVSGNLSSDDTLLLNENNIKNIQIKEKVIPDTTVNGEQKTLVLLTYLKYDLEGNEVNTPPSSPTIEKIQNTMQEANKFYQENSYNKMSLEASVDIGQAADVRGWYMLPISPTFILNNELILIDKQLRITALAINKADEEIDFSQYSRLIIICDFPIMDTGAATLGKILIPSKDGVVPLSIAWISSNYNNFTRVINHELGHNFRHLHASSIDKDCDINNLPKNIKELSECSNPYGDSLDTMGHGELFHFNGLHKLSSGWLDSKNIIKLSEVGKYTFTLDALELASQNPKVIVIEKNQNPYYSFSFRHPLHLEREYLDERFDGVEIRTIFPYGCLYFTNYCVYTDKTLEIKPKVSSPPYYYVYPKGMPFEGQIDDNKFLRVSTLDVIRDYEHPENSQLTVEVEIFNK